MNEVELKQLIEKYYNGESTEDEEKILREFFRRPVIPRGYEAEKVIFGFYDEAGEIPEPSNNFEDQIIAAIDAAENKKRPLIRRYFIAAASIAAGLLIIAGSYFIFAGKSAGRDTFRDPDLAYAETIKILRGVSAQLNRGAEVLEPVGKINEMSQKSFKTINKSTRLVEENLRSLDYLKKAVKTQHR